MFQVLEVNTSDRTQFTVAPFRISMTPPGYTLGDLSLIMYSDVIEGNKFTSQLLTDGVLGVDNSVAAPKLTSALGTAVSTITDIVGHKCVLSFSRDSDGRFAIYLNSVLIDSQTDTRPFHRINNIEDAAYFIGASRFLSYTNESKLYCHLHFSKSLSEGEIKRIHTELMTHYDI